jgi:large subunit ribosomal protein L19e
MVNVSYQRRMAAEILKCGVHRVWIDPDQLDEVAEAVTRGDVRRLISYRVIQVRQKLGVSRGRTRMMKAQKAKGRRKGPGSRRGSRFARAPKKRTWIRTIRPLRSELRSLRGEGKLDATTYRIYYRKARGNMFKSRAHLLTQLEAAGVITEGEIKEKESAKMRAKREREERRRKAMEARARVRKKAAEARARREAAKKEAEEAKAAAAPPAPPETPEPKEEAAPEPVEEEEAKTPKAEEIPEPEEENEVPEAPEEEESAPKEEAPTDTDEEVD